MNSIWKKIRLDLQRLERENMAKNAQFILHFFCSIVAIFRQDKLNLILDEKISLLYSVFY